MPDHKRMSVMTLVLPLSMIIGTTWLASVAVGQSTSKAPSVQQLLQEYTRALDATQSFTDTFEEVDDFSHKTTPAQPRAEVGRQFKRGRNRADGKRIYCQKYMWGHFNQQEKKLPEDKPRYHLRIEADKKQYVHSKAINNPHEKGSAGLQPSMVETPRLNMETFAGIYGHVGCDKRLDAVLAAAKKISVRPATENINGFPCHVIDADTEYGRYTVWLDPAHGYNAARVTRKATGGDKEHEWPMPPGDHASGSVLVTRFEQVTGIWVPVEAEHETNYTSGRLFRRSRSHYKRANIVLNPDHDKLGSFDIPLLENPANDPELKDETRVQILLPSSVWVKATWKDGKVVDESGKVINISELWATSKSPSPNTNASNSNRSNRPGSSSRPNRSNSSRRRRAY